MSAASSTSPRLALEPTIAPLTAEHWPTLRAHPPRRHRDRPRDLREPTTDVGGVPGRQARRATMGRPRPGRVGSRMGGRLGSVRSVRVRRSRRALGVRGPGRDRSGHWTPLAAGPCRVHRSSRDLDHPVRRLPGERRQPPTPRTRGIPCRRHTRAGRRDELRTDGRRVAQRRAHGATQPCRRCMTLRAGRPRMRGSACPVPADP